MGQVIAQTTYETLEPGTYRGRLGAAVIENEGDYGPQVAMRWDILDEGLEDRFLKAWASAKLSGGKRPSKLYQWTSVLLFGGKPLPEGFDLDIDNLLDREALLVVEVVTKDGIERNRIAQLLPLRPKGATVVKGNGSQPAEVALKPRAPVAVPSVAPDPGDVPDWLDEAGRPVETI